MLLDTADQQLHKVACRGIDETAWKKQRRTDGEPAHPVLQTKDVILLPNLDLANAGLDSGYFTSQGFQSYLGLPLVAKDQVVGILSFYSREARGYSDEEINFLRSLAGQAAVAIQNARLLDELKKAPG